MKKRTILLASLLISLAASRDMSSAHAQNLVTNSGFSAGNTGFATALTYAAPVDNAVGYLQPDGLYSVAKNPASHDNTSTGFDAHKNPLVTASFSDHTGDASGNMLLANANTLPLETTWQQNISALTAGATYNFSAFFAYWGALGDAPNTTIRFAILAGGTAVSTYSDYLAVSPVFAPPMPPTNTTVPALSTSVDMWNQHSFLWTNTTNATDITIRIESVNAQGGGYDYAIDDISLVAVPEPSTFVVFGLTGFMGMAGLLRRRRMQ